MTLTRPYTRLCAFFAAALLALGLGACGEMQETGATVTGSDEVTITLDRHPNATHAAIYAAQSTGAFERAGLDVTIETPASPASPLRALERGESDLIVMHQPDLLVSRDNGSTLQAVAALVREPLTSVISLPRRPLRSADDLEDRTIGTTGLRGQEAILRAVLRNADIPAENVRMRDLGFGLTRPLIERDVDGTLGLRTVDALALRRDDRRPTTLTLDQLGVPSHPGLVLTATEATVRDRGPLLRRVVQAIGWGAGELQRNPAAGVDALVKVTGRSDRAMLRASADATIPLMFPEDESRPWGWMSPTEWARIGVWMQEQGVLANARTGARGSTNEYLAGEGVGDKTDQ